MSFLCYCMTLNSEEPMRKMRRSLIRSIVNASVDYWRYTCQTWYQISNYMIIQQRSHYQEQSKGDDGNGKAMLSEGTTVLSSELLWLGLQKEKEVEECHRAHAHSEERERRTEMAQYKERRKLLPATVVRGFVCCTDSCVLLDTEMII